MHKSYLCFIKGLVLDQIDKLCSVKSLDKHTVNAARSDYLLYAHDRTYRIAVLLLGIFDINVFCAARKTGVSVSIAFLMLLTEKFLPTSKYTVIFGNTTRSLVGTKAIITVSLVFILSLIVKSFSFYVLRGLFFILRPHLHYNITRTYLQVYKRSNKSKKRYPIKDTSSKRTISQKRMG